MCQRAWLSLPLARLTTTNSSATLATNLAALLSARGKTAPRPASLAAPAVPTGLSAKVIFCLASTARLIEPGSFLHARCSPAFLGAVCHHGYSRRRARTGGFAIRSTLVHG